MCDSACVHAAEVCDLVCTCGMTEGSGIGELFYRYLQQKVYLFHISKAMLEFGQDF